MKAKAMPSKHRSRQKDGNFLPVLCNILGTILLTAVILTALPMTVPRLLGYGIYNVVSGSMAPAIPVGSVILTAPTEPETVREGDVIAFASGGTVVTHRVAHNAVVYREFVTKGDANEQEDVNNVSYDDLIGRVVFHAPVLGALMAVYASPVGKLYALGVAGCGVLFNLLAGAMRARKREERRQQEERRQRREDGFRRGVPADTEEKP